MCIRLIDFQRTEEQDSFLLLLLSYIISSSTPLPCSPLPFCLLPMSPGSRFTQEIVFFFFMFVCFPCRLDPCIVSALWTTLTLYMILLILKCTYCRYVHQLNGSNHRQLYLSLRKTDSSLIPDQTIEWKVPYTRIWTSWPTLAGLCFTWMSFLFFTQATVFMFSLIFKSQLKLKWYKTKLSY